MAVTNTTELFPGLVGFQIPSTHEDLVFLAKVSEQAEKYEEMVTAMKHVVMLGVELAMEERNLLSVAYKNVVGSRRASWRILNSILQKEESKGNDHQCRLIKQYRAQIEKELSLICDDILDLLSKHLIPNSSTGEAKVFFYKMKGDYHRYYAEIATENPTQKDLALDSYTKASDIASSTLSPTHPIRLGLALNFSVFYYEILKSPDRGCSLARQAFDEAVTELDQLDEESYKESTLIMQLLRDNLTLWTEDLQDGKDDGDGTKCEDYDNFE